MKALIKKAYNFLRNIIIEHKSSEGLDDDTETLAYTDFMDEMLDSLDDLIDDDRRIESIPSTPVKKKTAVVHFHGYPFFKSDFNNNERRDYGTSEDHLGKHLHSDFSYESYKISNEVSKNKILTEDQDRTLQLSDSEIASSIRSHLTDSELNSAMQDYVNCFCKNPEKFYADLKKAFPGLNLNPIVSMSKTPEHAFKFALAHFESDKTKIIDPEYSHDGIPKHRLAGVIFVTLHEYEANQADETQFDVTQAIKNGGIEPHPHYRHQLEVAFFGGVAHGTVVAAIPVVFPILSTEHTKDIAHKSSWYKKLFKVAALKKDGEVSEASGTPGGYKKYVTNQITEIAKKKEDLSNSQEYVKKYCAGSVAFNGGLIGKMKDFYVEHALKIAKQKAVENGYELRYIDSEGNLCEYKSNGQSPHRDIDNQINSKDKCTKKTDAHHYESLIIPSTPPRVEFEDRDDEEITVPSSPFSEMRLGERMDTGVDSKVFLELLGIVDDHSNK